jgi:hypothetical protein
VNLLITDCSKWFRSPIVKYRLFKLVVQCILLNWFRGQNGLEVKLVIANCSKWLYKVFGELDNNRLLKMV